MTSQISPQNFVSTTLRAPVAVSDTQLQLAAGTGVLFNPITAGNYCYVIVNDATTAEVMKYVSAGNVINDVITVVRAQDNTTAKSFPVGACVAIGWNVEQVVDLIDQEVLNLISTTPLQSNTMLTIGPPVGAPAVNIIYAVEVSTGRLWFWNGTVWVFINSNSTQLVTSTPTLAPPGNIRWAINTITSMLFYWTGLTWLLVAGGSSGGPNFLQVNSRRYLAPGGIGGGGGIALVKGTDSAIGGAGGFVANGMPFPAQCLYKSNLAIPDAVVVDTVPPFDNTLKFPVNSVIQLTTSFGGVLADSAHDCRAIISIHHANDGYEWQTVVTYTANAGLNVNVGGQVSSDPFQVVAGDHFDVAVTVVDGGASFAGMFMQELSFAASVIALI